MQDIFPRRSRSRLLALVLTAIAVGCGPAETVAPPPVPATPLRATTDRSAPDAFRIVFLGDSLSAGRGLGEHEAFPALVEAKLREQGHAVEVINAGVSGDTTAGGLARLDWVMRSEPDLLVVELGANDALRGQPLVNIERNLREIVRRGRQGGAGLLLLGMDVPTNYGQQYARGFSELYARVAEDANVDFVPGFIRDVGLDPSLMQPDGLHPTAEGHRKLAARLALSISRHVTGTTVGPTRGPGRPFPNADQTTSDGVSSSK